MRKSIAGLLLAAATVGRPAVPASAACDLDPHAPPLAECLVQTVYDAVGGEGYDCVTVSGAPPYIYYRFCT